MKFLPRIVLLGAALYLAADTLVFHGPVHRWLNQSKSETTHLAARVSGRPITRSQLNRAIAERLWLEGKSMEIVTPSEMKSHREAALQDLIDSELLQLRTQNSLPGAGDQEIDDRLKRLSDRFENEAAFTAAMKSQGIADLPALRERLASRIRQEKLIERLIAPDIKVTDHEAREWFEANKDSISLPERIEARHVFLATLDHPPEEAKQKLDAALAELLERKKDFPTLARELSEDMATKEKGGNLGWMTRERLPADFAAPVFSLEVNKPTLVRTKLGWHLVEVTARKPAATRNFEQAKPEILAALDATKRRKAVGKLRDSLRKAEGATIEIFSEASDVSSPPAP